MGKLTLSALEATAIGPVWVTNSSAGDGRSIISFGVQKPGSDRLDPVNVPITYIPIDLTSQVTKEQLMKSAEFRRAVTFGLLTLVDPEEAERAMSNPQAQKEAMRLVKESREVMEAQTAATLGRETVETNAADLSPRVTQYIELLMETEPEDALLTLRNYGRLTNAEYRAVRNKARENSKYAEISTYCEEQIIEHAA